MGSLPEYFIPSLVNSFDTFTEHLLCVGPKTLEVHSHVKGRLT